MSLIASDQFRIVVGLGKSGMSLVRFLAQQGVRFAVADTRANPPELETLKRDYPQVEVRCGELDVDFLCRASELYVSPGLAVATPALAEAAARGVKLSGDIDLFARHAKAPIVAITGSNAKSTVTTRITSYNVCYTKLLRTQQDDQRQHLRCGFPLAKVGHRDMRSSTELGHPFTQCRHDYLASDDGRGSQGQPEIGVFGSQQHQRHRHHQLVCDRIEEGAERRALLPAAGQVAIEPIGHGGNREDAAGSPIAPGER